MGSRKRSKAHRSGRGILRGAWFALQVVLVVVGALAVAVYVSRQLPPLTPQPSSEPVRTPSPKPRAQAEDYTHKSPPSNQPMTLQQPETVHSPALPVLPVASLKVTSREIDAGTSQGKMVALTFDAGSSAEPTPRILDTLSKRGVRCTFFLTGKWIERYPELARRIVQEGHELGNHSWSHPPFTSLPNDQIREQLRRTEEIALQVCGRSTKPFFRPPYGDRDRRVREVVAQEGYLTIYWTIDSLDSVKKDITPAQIEHRLRRLIRPGAIVLLHCGSEATAQALPAVLDWLEQEGYRAVTLSELLDTGNNSAGE